MLKALGSAKTVGSKAIYSSLEGSVNSVDFGMKIFFALSGKVDAEKVAQYWSGSMILIGG